jgi:hypothetical protein
VTPTTTPAAPGIELETADQLLRICDRTGRLISLRSKSAPDQEFLSVHETTPAFTVQYLDDRREYRQLSSLGSTASIDVRADGEARVLTARFEGIGGLDLDVALEVRADKAEPFSRWSVTLDNRVELDITDVQFPVVVCAYALGGKPGSEAAVWPLGCGRLMTDIRPDQLQPDNPRSWQFVPTNTDTHHYPGYTFAQFLAYYNDRAGVYIACEDAEGRIKVFKPLHHRSGIRLGVGHVGDWPSPGTRRLEYDTVLGTFVGDWTAAAALYRDWSLRQPWASRAITERTDMPEWMREAPPHIMVRIQGEIDGGPTEPNAGYVPYSRAIEPLGRLEERLGAPILPVLMGWERPGPWVYPDCFPPAGGEPQLLELSGLVRHRGWHLGTFCNGTRWVTGHLWSGYDGRKYFEDHNGAATVCRLPDGRPWEEFWDATWRPSYSCCVGVESTRRTAISFIETVVELGFDWIQFFDQNVGACAFPCFADGHGHPAKPGLYPGAPGPARVVPPSVRAERAPPCLLGRGAGQRALDPGLPGRRHPHVAAGASTTEHLARWTDPALPLPVPRADLAPRRLRQRSRPSSPGDPHGLQLRARRDCWRGDARRRKPDEPRHRPLVGAAGTSHR